MSWDELLEEEEDEPAPKPKPKPKPKRVTPKPAAIPDWCVTPTKQTSEEFLPSFRDRGPKTKPELAGNINEVTMRSLQFVHEHLFGVRAHATKKRAILYEIHRRLGDALGKVKHK